MVYCEKVILPLKTMLWGGGGLTPQVKFFFESGMETINPERISRGTYVMIVTIIFVGHLIM